MSHCHCWRFGPQLPPEPDYLYLVIHSPWELAILPGPITPSTSPCTARPQLPCHPLRPAHSTIRIPVNSYFIHAPFLPPFPLVRRRRSPDLAPSCYSRPLSPRSIPSGRTEPNPQLGSLASHVGNGHPSRSQISSQSSSLSSLLPHTSPFQLHQFPITATVPAPTPPLLTMPASYHPSLRPRISGKYLVDHPLTRPPRPGFVPSRPLAGSVSSRPHPRQRQPTISFTLVRPRSHLQIRNCLWSPPCPSA